MSIAFDNAAGGSQVLDSDAYNLKDGSPGMGGAGEGGAGGRFGSGEGTGEDDEDYYEQV